MNKAIIRGFKECFEAQRQRWEGRGERAVYTSIESKAVVGITGKSYLASVAVWGVGACDTIALSTVTGKEMWAERYDFQCFTEVVGSPDVFINFLAAHNSATKC